MYQGSALHIVVLITATIIPLGLIQPTYQRRDQPGATGLLLMIFGASLYELMLVSNILTKSVNLWFITANISMLATTILTIGWFLLVTEYVGVLEINKKIVAPICAYTIVTQGAVWTHPIHKQTWLPLDALTGTETFPEASGPIVTYLSSFEYLLVVLSLGLLLREAITSTGLRQKQAGALLAGIIPGVVLFLADDVGLVEVDLTPLGVVGAVLIITWALLYADFLDIVPIGRQRAVNNLADAFFILDDQDRVIDANPKAQTMFESSENWQGTPIESLLGTASDIYHEINVEESGEIELTIDQETRFFDITVSLIRSSESDFKNKTGVVGKTVSMRDITELRRREEDLRIVKDILSRVFRHNIRNDLIVIQGHLERIKNQAEETEIIDSATTAKDSSDQLLDHTEKARSIERLIDESLSTVNQPVETFVGDVVDRYQQQDNAVTFNTAIDDVSVRVIKGFEIAVENAVENAIKHNPKPVTIELETEVSDDTVDLIVRDDGSGISSHEVAVIENEEESDLAHGSGVGLWVMKWYVKKTGGNLNIVQANSGTKVVMTLPRD